MAKFGRVCHTTWCEYLHKKKVNSNNKIRSRRDFWTTNDLQKKTFRVLTIVQTHCWLFKQRLRLVSSNGHHRNDRKTRRRGSSRRFALAFIDQLRFTKLPCRRNEFFTRRLAKVSRGEGRCGQSGAAISRFDRRVEQQPGVNGPWSRV